MTISMYQSSIPVFVRALENLSEVLRKGEEFAEARKIEPAVLVTARLAPDMYPLSAQVQIATDVARRGVARLAGVEPPTFDDEERTFAELQERIRRAVDYMETFKPEQIDGSEDKEVVIQLRGEKARFTGLSMLLNFSIPNVFFHCATAYDILRHNGVEIGKKDFLGDLPV